MSAYELGAWLCLLGELAGWTVAIYALLWAFVEAVGGHDHLDDEAEL